MKVYILTNHQMHKKGGLHMDKKTTSIRMVLSPPTAFNNRYCSK